MALRIVLFRGSKLPGGDRLVLRFLRIYITLFSRKFSRYKWCLLFSTHWGDLIQTNQLLNFDDPEYTESELASIKKWEDSCRAKGVHSALAVTTNYTRMWLENSKVSSTFSVIPQGHGNSKIEITSKADTSILKIVYASPYIHMDTDAHGNHINWNATTLLREIWPLVDKGIFELHLIGDVGVNARRYIQSPNIILHGLKSIEECAEILKSCDIGLYPRTKDNYRQAQKISEYIGCILAIVTFDLVDTSLVKELEVGISVSTVREFADALIHLYNNRKVLEHLRRNSLNSSEDLSWKFLGSELDRFLVENPS